MVKNLCALCFGLMLILQPVTASANTHIPFLSFIAGLLNQGKFPQSDKYITDDDIVVVADDGVELEGNIFIPTNMAGLAPAVIFINSWGLNEYEYLTQAGELAEKGYIVFSYTTRGFGQSGGLINTAGPKDMSDLSKVIDFLIENYQVDPNAIGAAGISYGAGISLLGAAHDPRIKAVGALSGWGNLVDSLYGNNTPRLVWGEILTTAGQLTGRPEPILEEYWGYIKNQVLEQKDAVTAWALERSPISYISNLNANNTAVYFSNNYGDNLFQANSVINLYTQLTSAKHLYLQPGTHASAELVPPLIGAGDNYIFEDLYKWFDIHLKGEENSLSYANPFQMKVKFKNYMDGFSGYPIEETTNQKYYFHPRRLFDTGDLESHPYSRWSRDNTIRGGSGTLFSTQIPLLSSTLEQLQIPTQTSIPLASRTRGIYFQTGRLNDGMKIRGIPNVKVQVQPRSDSAQIVAYLYDMNAFGVGKLITHGVYTLPVANSGEKVELSIDLVPTAYDLPAGNRLVVAFDTRDPHYKSPADGSYYLDFEFSSNKQSTLTVPRL